MLLTQKKRDGDTIHSRGETCRQRRPHRRTGIKPTGRRAIGIRSILQDLTIGGNFFPLSRRWFRLLGEKPPANRRGV